MTTLLPERTTRSDAALVAGDLREWGSGTPAELAADLDLSMTQVSDALGYLANAGRAERHTGATWRLTPEGVERYAQPSLHRRPSWVVRGGDEWQPRSRHATDPSQPAARRRERISA